MIKASFESIQAFMMCVDTEGFSSAAKALNKSQSTISCLVANLEAGLQMALFDRSGKKPKLTQHGEVIYSYARNVILAHQELLSVSGELASDQEIEVVLVISEYVPVEQRMYVKNRIADNINNTRLTLLSAESHDSLLMLLNGEADVIVIPAMKSRMNYPSRVTGRRTWLDSVLHVYCAKTHVLGSLKEVAEHDLKDKRRIRLIRGTTVNESPRHDIMTDSLDKAYSLCAQGLGWCELPEWIVKQKQMLGDDRLVMLPVPPSRKLLEFDVIYRNDQKGRFINGFITTLTEEKVS